MKSSVVPLTNFEGVKKYIAMELARVPKGSNGSALRQVYWYYYDIDMVETPAGLYFTIENARFSELAVRARKCRDAYELCLEIAETNLRFPRSLHDPLTFPMREFSSSVMGGRFSAPKKKTNRRGDELWNRDWWIIHLMTFLEPISGLRHTRGEFNSDDKQNSIADAIAEVFSESDFGATSYQAVVDVWKDKRKRRIHKLLRQLQ